MNIHHTIVINRMTENQRAQMGQKLRKLLKEKKRVKERKHIPQTILFKQGSLGGNFDLR